MRTSTVVLLLALLTAASGLAQPPDPADLDARGVTFYAAFDGDPVADYARGNPEPISLSSIAFVAGRVGQAVLTKKSREVELGKLEGRASSLNYDAAGHLFGERGTVAYWFRPGYDLDDPTVRSGSNSTGPYLVNVSALEDTYYNQFIRAGIKGGSFYMWVVDRDGAWHGPNFAEALRTWKQGEWHHIVMTWDAAQGMRLYADGVLKYSTWGDDPFPPATPWKIGVGAPPPTDRPSWTSGADAAYDELIMLDRAVTDDEVGALMEGRYLDLARSPAVAYTDEQLAERRASLLIEDDPNRVSLVAEDGVIAATVERLQPTDIDMRFIRADFLADGRWQPAVTFAQGGLTMPRDVTVRLSGEADYAVIAGRLPEDEALSLAGEALATTAAGAARRAFAPADELSLHVPGAAEIGEVLAYRITPGAAQGTWTHDVALAAEGSAHDLACDFAMPEEGLDATAEGYAEAAVQITAQADPLLRKLQPADRRLLVPGDGEAPALTVPATRHLYLAGPSMPEHSAVRRLRLTLPVQTAAAAPVLRITIRHPYEPTAFYATADVELRWGGAGGGTLDLTIAAPGMIFPASGRPLVELVCSEAFALAGTPQMQLDTVPAREQGAAFARDTLRLLNEEFTSRMGINFMYFLRRIDVDNPLTRGLARALFFDPDNELALDLAGWMRMIPWPPFDRRPSGPESFPLLARYAREAALQARDVIHWWIDERQDETGYMVGRADMWNDDTKLFNEYSFLWLLSGDDKLAAAMERYLAAHWASGRMVNGWSEPWTDIVHSAEEASYLEPTMALVRYGDPLHIERLLATASNIDTWTGITGPDHRHFRSNFFTADRMKTEGEFGHDVGLNATAMTASMYLAWYCRHPVASEHLTQWMRAWVEDSLAEAPDKPAGRIPAWVDFATHEIGPAQEVYLAELTMMMNAAYQLTGDEFFLQPLTGYLERGESRWPQVLNMAAADLRRALGPGDYDGLLLQGADERLQYIADDSFFQRGLYYDELPGVLGWQITGDRRYLEATCYHAWRNNWRARRIYTQIDPHKDRVYPWARYVLPWMYCGGNALDGRGSAPWPTIAVSWDAGWDFAALVEERTEDRLAVTAWNFGDARRVGMRPWGLAPGIWRLTVSAEGAAPTTREVSIERGMTIPIDLPARGEARIALAQLEPGDWSPARADLALSATEGATVADGRLSVVVHNIGALDAPACRATLSAGETVIAEAPVPAIAAPLDFLPKTAQVSFDLPEGAAGELTVTIDAEGAVAEVTELNNTLTATVR